MKLSERRGSVTVEATISLTAFVFCIITFLSIINICRAQAKISMAINNTAKEISQYSYIYGLTGLNESRKNLAKRAQEEVEHGEIKKITDATNSMLNEIEAIGETGRNTNFTSTDDVYKAWDDIKKNLSGAAGNIEEMLATDPEQLVYGMGAVLGTDAIDIGTSRLIAAPIAKGMVRKHLTDPKHKDADKYLRAIGVVNGLDGLDFSNSTLFPQGNNEINIVVVYKVKAIPLLPINTEFTFCQTASTRGWLTGDDNPYSNPKKVAEKAEHGDKDKDSVWKLHEFDRIRAIKAGEMAKFASKGLPRAKTDSTVYIQGFDPADNEFVRINTMDTFSKKYQGKGYESALKELTNKIKSSTKNVKTIKLQSGTDQNAPYVPYDIPEGKRNYRIVLVIPENAGEAANEIKSLLDKNGYYNGVKIEVVQGYGNSPKANEEKKTSQHKKKNIYLGVNTYVAKHRIAFSNSFAFHNQSLSA